MADNEEGSAEDKDDAAFDLVLLPLTDERCSNCEQGGIEKSHQQPGEVGSAKENSCSETAGDSEKPKTLIKVSSLQKMQWQQALHKAKSLEDPWSDFPLNEVPTEIVKRHRYSALRKKWTSDEVMIKIENKAFDKGAMRECFRLKKLSNFHRNDCWQKAHNYVAKSYIESVERNVYFEDVRLQMDAKLWGEEFNRHNPPKKVDIMQMSVLEFVERPGSPLYHLEHFIEGNYVKYNSNSGFVSEVVRCTPQAFSHFTFERSGHHLIVVDIQGVGDLWTDPQIHSADGTDYGDGNLGTKGMALFFHSHACNRICERLGLTSFDLAPSEQNQQQKLSNLQNLSATKMRGNIELCHSPSANEISDLHGFLRKRTYSGSNFRSLSPTSPTSPELMDVDSPFSPSWSSDAGSLSNGRPRFRSGDSADYLPGSRSRSRSGDSDYYSLPPRTRTFSGMSGDSDSDSSATWSREEEKIQHLMSMMKSRPSNVAAEVDLRELRDLVTRTGGSVLGEIHLDIAKYHELGRFKNGDGKDCDMEAAMFHLQQAAHCEVLEAIITLARLYLGLPTDILVNTTVEEHSDNIDRGIDFMIQAAEAGDRSAMIYMAKAFELGDGLGLNRSKDWSEAAYWYDRAIHTMENDENGEFNATMDDPLYQLLAREAELHRTGGYNLEKNASYAGELYQQAADAAMAAMKGRLANKYYALAEETWGEVDEKED